MLQHGRQWQDRLAELSDWSVDIVLRILCLVYQHRTSNQRTSDPSTDQPTSDQPANDTPDYRTADMPARHACRL